MKILVITSLTLCVASGAMAKPHPKPHTVPVRQGAPKRAKLNVHQQVALANALRSLRRMDSAVSVGVSLMDYNSRLIDTKADVEEDLRQLPAGFAKDRLKYALGCYQDVSTLWGETIQYKYKEILDQAETGKIVKKYGLPWKEMFAQQSNADEDPSLVEISDGTKLALLTGIWMVAKNNIVAASGTAK